MERQKKDGSIDFFAAYFFKAIGLTTWPWPEREVKPDGKKYIFILNQNIEKFK